MNEAAISERLTLQCQPEECGRLYSFLENTVHKVTESRAFDDFNSRELLLNLKMTCEEWFTNVINYAYKDRQAGEGRLEICINVIGRVLQVTFLDEGAPFNPLGKGISLQTDPADGGMGIFIMQELTLDQNYRRENDRNVLTLSWQL